MAVPASRWNGLCWVCGQGFPSDDQLLIHVMIHPGRSLVDRQNANEAQKRLDQQALIQFDEVFSLNT